MDHFSLSDRQEPSLQNDEHPLFSPFYGSPKAASQRVKQVWAIGGGKGGVGKSMLASSLAVALSKTGNKVAALDLDLGAANLHTLLGIDLPKQSLSDFFNGRQLHLNECLVKTGIPNLEIISGAQDAVHVANLEDSKKNNLIKQIKQLDADYVVLDLGAGTTFHTLDFFICADVGIVCLLPEPTSIENAYRFIKSTYYRRLLLNPNLNDIVPFVQQAMESNPSGLIRTPSDLFREVSKANPEAATRLKEAIERFTPKLIVNQSRTQSDIDIGFSIKSVCKKYFGIEMDYVGYLDHDNTVWQAIRKKRPLVTEFPQSKLVASIERMTHYLLNNRRHFPSFLA